MKKSNTEIIFKNLKPYLKELKELRENSYKKRIKGSEMIELYHKHFGSAKGTDIKFFFNFMGYEKIKINSKKFWRKI